jgi:hypothetical protein
MSKSTSMIKIEIKKDLSNKKKIVPENEIILAMSKKCIHRIYLRTNSQVQPVICDGICGTIFQCLSGGQVFSKTFIKKFYESFCTAMYKGNHYRNHCCLAKNNKVITNSLSNIVTNENLGEDVLKTMILDTTYDNFFINLKQNNKSFIFSNKLLEYVLVEKFQFDNSTTDSILFNTLFPTIKSEFINELLLCKNKVICTKLAQYIDKYDGIITDTMVVNACKSLPHSMDIVKLLISRGHGINESHFKTVCKYGDIVSIQFILDMTRIKPTSVHFKAIQQTVGYLSNTERIQRMDWREILPERWVKTPFDVKKAHVLISHGFVPTYNDLYDAIKYKGYIPNIERFKINIDKKFLEKCWDEDFYPPYDFNMVSKEMVMLQKICHSRATKKIQQYLGKQQDIIPDRKCMENACRFKNNTSVLNLLTQKGGNVTIKCIENCANEFKSNDMLKIIIAQFKEMYNKKIETYEAKISNLENKLSLCGKSVTNYGDNHGDDGYDDNNHESDEELIDVSNVIKNKSKLKNSKISKKVISDAKKNKVIIVDDNDDGDNVKLVLFSNYNLQRPENPRQKSDVPTPFRTYFHKKKTDKMSFIEIKKDVIQCINKNKWFKDDNQKLINLPTPLKKKLKINANEYVSFSDIDNLITLFYSV